MTYVSDMLARVQPSATSIVTDAARKLRAQGQDIISLSVGEPDFPTPGHIIDAATIAMQEGQTRYTTIDGTPALKDAISAKFATENGLAYTADQISVNCGGKHSIYNALAATLNPGDEVIIPAPHWVSYPEIVRLCGATPVIVAGKAAHKYKLQPSDLERAITPKTRWLILNSPGNPTGSVYNESELSALGDVLAQHPHVMILSDDIYEHIRYNGLAYATIAAVRDDLKARILTMNGVSKAYAMTGWRIGYAGGPEWLIKAMAKLQSQSTSNPCSISQAAAVAALQGPQAFLQERCESFRKRRDFMVDAIDDMDGLHCTVPDGAFYIFVEADDLIGRSQPSGAVIGNDVEIAEYLLNAARVAVVPGSAFGHAGAFRISYAAGMDDLKEASRRIAAALRELR